MEWANSTSHPQYIYLSTKLGTDCLGVQSDAEGTYVWRVAIRNDSTESVKVRLDNREVRQEDRRAAEKLWIMEHACRRQFTSALNAEGWDHLNRYTQHWIERLGEGPDSYSQVMVKIFDLNTLCRLDIKHGVEERAFAASVPSRKYANCL